MGELDEVINNLESIVDIVPVDLTDDIESLKILRNKLNTLNYFISNGTLCNNLDANKDCKNMCLTRCIYGHEFYQINK